MNKKKTEVLFDLADINGGYVSALEARENGVAQTYLSLVVKEGLFLKVSKGLYIRKGSVRDPFYELGFRYHKAVFCRQTALYLHGLIEEPALEVNLPLNYLNKGIPHVHVHHAGAKEYSLGQIFVVTPRGNLVNSYSLERTMVDLLREKERYGKQEFLRLWHKAKEKSPYMEELRRLAEAFHVAGELTMVEFLD